MLYINNRVINNMLFTKHELITDIKELIISRYSSVVLLASAT